MAWIMSSGSARSMMSAKGSMASPRMATRAARTAACSAARCGSASTAIRAFTPAPCAPCRPARARARTSGDGSCNCLICSAMRAGSCKRRLTALRAAWISSSLSGRNSRPAGQIGEGGRVKLVDQGRPLAVIELRIEEFLQESLGQLRPAGLKQQLRRAEDLRRRGRIRGQQGRNHGVFRRREVDRLPGGPGLLAPGGLCRGRLGLLLLGRRLVEVLCRRGQCKAHPGDPCHPGVKQCLANVVHDKL